MLSHRLSGFTGPVPSAMRRAVEKFGFIPCGDITLTEGPEAGAPRIAFEKVLE